MFEEFSQITRSSLRSSLFNCPSISGVVVVLRLLRWLSQSQTPSRDVEFDVAELEEPQTSAERSQREEMWSRIRRLLCHAFKTSERQQQPVILIKKRQNLLSGLKHKLYAEGLTLERPSCSHLTAVLNCRSEFSKCPSSFSRPAFWSSQLCLIFYITWSSYNCIYTISWGLIAKTHFFFSIHFTLINKTNISFYKATYGQINRK